MWASIRRSEIVNKPSDPTRAHPCRHGEWQPHALLLTSPCCRSVNMGWRVDAGVSESPASS